MTGIEKGAIAAVAKIDARVFHEAIDLRQSLAGYFRLWRNRVVLGVQALDLLGVENGIGFQKRVRRSTSSPLSLCSVFSMLPA